MRSLLFLVACALTVALVAGAATKSDPSGDPKPTPQQKQQRYVTETKREREQMERDRLRIRNMIKDDSAERKYRFVYPEPDLEATTPLSAEQMEAQEAAKAKEKKGQRYSTETKREREQMERDRLRIRGAIKDDSAERKYRFVYATTQEPSAREEEASEVAATPAPATECKLTLKFPDGTQRVREYSPREPLAAVRLFVHFQSPLAGSLDKVVLRKADKQFTSAMMSASLDSLGLCPASELQVKLN